MNILDLPLEVLFHILNLLEPNEIYPISGLISRKFTYVFNSYTEYNRDKLLEIETDKVIDMYNSIKNGIKIENLAVRENVKYSSRGYIQEILKMNNLKTLTVSCDFHDYLEDVAEGLRYNSTCKNLSLRVDMSLRMSFYSMCHRLRNVVHLDVPGNDLGDKRTRILCRYILKNSSIKYLNLSNNRITSDSIDHITSIFKKSLELDISLNFLGSLSCIHIADKINSSSIESLNLSSCSIADSGTSYLFEILERNNTLKNLKIGDNYKYYSSDYEYYGDILRSIKINTSIESLDIGRCKLKLDEIMYNVLKINKTLKKLNVSYNHEDYFINIYNGLMENRTVTHVGLNGMLRGEDVNRLVDIIDVN